MESIGVLARVILGGMRSIPGAILGATVVTVLNLQVLKGLSLWLNELRNAGVSILGFNLADLTTQLEPAKYERMVFGLILVIMMIFRPQGILPAKRRVRELEDGWGAASPRSAGNHQALRWAHRPQRGEFRPRGGTHRLHHRAERSRQDHVLQRLHGPLRARGGDGLLPRAGDPRPSPRRDHRPRDLPHVPEHPPLRQ